MVRKGGQLKVHARSTWGEGGQKRPKNGPHGLCMTPSTGCYYTHPALLAPAVGHHCTVNVFKIKEISTYICKIHFNFTSE